MRRYPFNASGNRRPSEIVQAWVQSWSASWRRRVPVLAVLAAAIAIFWGLRNETAASLPAYRASPIGGDLPPSRSARFVPAGAIAPEVGQRRPEPAAHRDPVLALHRGTMSLEALIALAAGDANLRAELRRRHALTTDADLRATLLQLLQSAPVEEQIAFAYQLLGDSDPQRRADGYRVLTQLALDDPRVLEGVLRGLHEEPDPAVLGVLVAGMQPGLLAAEDAGPIAARLFDLTRHPDARIRASVLSQLSRWMAGAQLEEPYFSALSDQDPAVRAAAIAGIGVSQVRSARLLDALFGLAANPAENAEDRHNALQALLGFPLTRAEIDLYRLLQADVPLHPGRG